MQNLRPLSARQERKLVDYLENEFLQLTRSYKKRLDPTSKTPTLSAYLEATRPILSIILQIPPFDPSTSLRTTFLLRLTNDAFTAISGYTPTGSEEIAVLFDWLDDMDQAWVVVLRLQDWNASEGVGVTLDLPADSSLKASQMSQTERTRLKSLLIGGLEMLEECIEALNGGQGQDGTPGALTVPEGFNDLFSATCKELGLGEEEPITGRELEM